MYYFPAPPRTFRRKGAAGTSPALAACSSDRESPAPVGLGKPDSIPSDVITPTGTGLQTDLFGRTQGTSVLAPGDSVGFFYPSGGSIAVTLSSGVPVIGESGFGGLKAGTTQINTSSSVGNRTYSVSYTSNQVLLTTASAPAADAISDLCQNCLFEYDPVTSQYNGTSLLSFDFYALNTDTVIPVIFNSEGVVIGFGDPDTPTSTGFQSFAYVSQGTTTDVLATGDYLGWYDEDGAPSPSASREVRVAPLLLSPSPLWEPVTSPRPPLPIATIPLVS
jgi:hypothetical protein